MENTNRNRQTSHFRKPKVLVVDDCRTVLEATGNALREIGCDVITSENIFVAPLVNREHPDVILMDVNVSTQKGTIAVEVLRKYSTGRNSVILLYSGKPARILSSLVSECGADGFICKSDGTPHLVREIQGILDKQRLKPAA